MAGDSQKWSEIARNGREWPGMAGKGQGKPGVIGEAHCSVEVRDYERKALRALRFL